MTTKSVVCYVPGSGGQRLVRLLFDRQWKIAPGRHLGWGEPGLDQMLGDQSIPKYPDIARLPDIVEIDNPHLMLNFHCLHSQVIKALFPQRRIIKINCNLQASLCRWWDVFGRQWYEKNFHTVEINPALRDLGITACAHAIWFHVDYYSRNIDSVADEVWNIAPGQGDFSDFMLEEFGLSDSAEFEESWQWILERAPLTPDMNRVMSSPMAF